MKTVLIFNFNQLLFSSASFYRRLTLLNSLNPIKDESFLICVKFPYVCERKWLIYKLVAQWAAPNKTPKTERYKATHTQPQPQQQNTEATLNCNETIKIQTMYTKSITYYYITCKKLVLKVYNFQWCVAFVPPCTVAMEYRMAQIVSLHAILYWFVKG